MLPARFALDPDRLARFQREAQGLASLNHPNIAAIYGLQEGDWGTLPVELTKFLSNAASFGLYGFGRRE